LPGGAAIRRFSFPLTLLLALPAEAGFAWAMDVRTPDPAPVLLNGNGKPVVSRLTAVFLVLFAFFCFAGLDASAKYAGAILAPLQIVWMRFVTHSLIATAVLRPWRSPELYRPRYVTLQIARAFFLLSATFCNFYAIRYLPLALTASIFFLAPFIVTALAGPFLGEWAGRRRWSAIVIGFIGALIIIRPGLAGFHPAMLLSLAATLGYSLYGLLTRRLAAVETTESLMLLPAIAAALVMIPAGLAQWVAVPDLLHWSLLLATGILGGLGHWVFIKAHEAAPAPVLAPFVYSQLIWMTALGYFIFGDIPDRATMTGAAVIVGSGLYLFYRESRAARAERRAAAPAAGPDGV
jgi:drug/metabolite transporter (DMT)-like permease